MTAAVAFDLDGVLLDSERTWADARRTVRSPTVGDGQPAWSGR